MESSELLRDLFQQHHATVLAAAYQITGNSTEAEDALQTVFARLLTRDLETLEKINRRYLQRAAVNAALDIVRARNVAKAVSLGRVEERLRDGSAGPERLYSASELRSWLREALSRLNPRSAEIFALRFFQDCTNAEIAEILGTSPGTVAVTLHRTRGQLQKAIGSLEGEAK
jgi:RNA polymerase sigma-70 factor (ECF subfamily)